MEHGRIWTNINLILLRNTLQKQLSILLGFPTARTSKEIYSHGAPGARSNNRMMSLITDPIAIWTLKWRRWETHCFSYTIYTQFFFSFTWCLQHFIISSLLLNLHQEFIKSLINFIILLLKSSEVYNLDKEFDKLNVKFGLI